MNLDDLIKLLNRVSNYLYNIPGLDGDGYVLLGDVDVMVDVLRAIANTEEIFCNHTWHYDLAKGGPSPDDLCTKCGKVKYKELS